MIALASGMSYLDLNFLGVPRVIATAVLHGPAGVALIDPGPSSTLPTLRSTLETAGIAMADVNAVLLTHIHLDHAGATGTLAHEVPGLRVFVHEKGAPHMAQPDKLIASATRLYGADMDRLWGEFRPVPAERMTVLRGGERIERRRHVARRRLYAGARVAPCELFQQRHRRRVRGRYRRNPPTRRRGAVADAAARTSTLNCGARA